MTPDVKNLSQQDYEYLIEGIKILETRLAEQQNPKCETCQDDPIQCGELPSLRHCPTASNNEDFRMEKINRKQLAKDVADFDFSDDVEDFGDNQVKITVAEAHRLRSYAALLLKEVERKDRNEHH
jgi:hypothetical protein